MNKVILIGRLTKEPELKFTPGSGTAVATFTIAVDKRASKDGKKEADFIPIVVWGKTAESCANHTGKGKLIGISGRIQTRNYKNKKDETVYVTEVVADEVQFIEWANGNKPVEGPTPGNDLTPVDDGDIPF